MRLNQKIIILFRATFVLCVVAIIYLAFTPKANPVSGALNDKVNHLIAFFSLMFLIDFSFPKTGVNWAKWLPIAGFAVGIEVVQSFFPYRDFSLYDIIADVAGMLLYLALLPFLRHFPLLKSRWQPAP